MLVLSVHMMIVYLDKLSSMPRSMIYPVFSRVDVGGTPSSGVAAVSFFLKYRTDSLKDVS